MNKIVSLTTYSSYPTSYKIKRKKKKIEKPHLVEEKAGESIKLVLEY